MTHESSSAQIVCGRWSAPLFSFFGTKLPLTTQYLVVDIYRTLWLSAVNHLHDFLCAIYFPPFRIESQLVAIVHIANDCTKHNKSALTFDTRANTQAWTLTSLRLIHPRELSQKISYADKEAAKSHTRLFFQKRSYAISADPPHLGVSHPLASPSWSCPFTEKRRSYSATTYIERAKLSCDRIGSIVQSYLFLCLPYYVVYCSTCKRSQRQHPAIDLEKHRGKYTVFLF